MIKEALEFIFATARADSNPKPHVIDIGRRRKKFFLESEVIDVETAKPRLHRYACDLASFAALVDTFHQTTPTVFIDQQGAEAVLDDDERDELVEMSFRDSQAVATLPTLAKGLSPKAMVKTLRTVYDGCLTTDDFLPFLRQLKFDVLRESHHANAASDESLGRAVQRKVHSKAGDVPEELTLRLPLFAVPTDPTPIVLRCIVDIDKEDELIRLIPVGDELARQRQQIIAELADRLRSLLTCDALVVAGSAEIHQA